MHVDSPPSLESLVEKLGGVLMPSADSVPTATGGDPYPHWDRIRHLRPPEGLSVEQWWLLIKLSRLMDRRPIALTDAAGSRFSFGTPDAAMRLLRTIDQRCAGQIAMPAVMTGGQIAQQRFIVNSRIEEAIRSSQLEGATTTRRVAKEMLRTRREPATKSERMILNNYEAMQFVRDGIGPELTPEDVLALHAIITEGTLGDASMSGRLQTSEDERIAVVNSITGKPVHTPPPARELERRMAAMCEFANSEDAKDAFTHPAFKAVILHFWLAYDHPFVDGNGRTARALFYWYMLQRDYWLVEFLSISRVLRAAPAKYAKAFLYTETDDNDLTYFLINQLDVLVKATDDLDEYLQRKADEIDQVEHLSRDAHLFNRRQLALLGLAIKDPAARFSFQSHASSHGVTHETARGDVTFLWEVGLLVRSKEGRNFVFTPGPDISRRLRKLAGQAR